MDVHVYGYRHQPFQTSSGHARRTQEEAADRILENSRECEEDIESKRGKIGTDLSTKLSPTEQTQLERLNPEIETLKEELSGVKTRHMEVRMFCMHACLICAHVWMSVCVCRGVE